MNLLNLGDEIIGRYQVQVDGLRPSFFENTSNTYWDRLGSKTFVVTYNWEYYSVAGEIEPLYEKYVHTFKF